MPVKTLEERSLEKHAPECPLSAEVVDHAWRCESQLRQAVGAAEDLLKARRDGESLSLGGHVIEGISRLDKARIFGMVWPAVLSRISYWEHHARRYVRISKTLERQMQSVRLQIDELQNA